MNPIQIEMYNQQKLVLASVSNDAEGFYVNNCGCVRYSTDSGRISSVIEPIHLGFYAEPDNCQILGTYTTHPQNANFDVPDEWLKPDEINGLYPIHGSANTLDMWVNSDGNLGTITRTEFGQKTEAFLSLLLVNVIQGCPNAFNQNHFPIKERYITHASEIMSQQQMDLEYENDLLKYNEGEQKVAPKTFAVILLK